MERRSYEHCLNIVVCIVSYTYVIYRYFVGCESDCFSTFFYYDMPSSRSELNITGYEKSLVMLRRFISF